MLKTLNIADLMVSASVLNLNALLARVDAGLCFMWEICVVIAVQSIHCSSEFHVCACDTQDGEITTSSPCKREQGKKKKILKTQMSNRNPKVCSLCSH